MSDIKKGLNTICTHVGEIIDEQFKGAVSPLYMSSSYAFEDVDVKRYPRYFNTPNQEGLSKKIAALEHAESALIFGSGMAAVSTALMAFTEEFDKYGISYSFTEGWTAENFETKIQDNTKVIYIETPSNPLLTITDLNAIGKLCRKHGIVSMIDNTFASPVNQNPIDFGIDVVIHSATKYMGGHSDICAGAVASSEKYIEPIFQLAKNFGGSLSDYTVWLLERSIKTMGLRVKAQNENAQQMAEYLANNEDIAAVHYPGLSSHPEHELAKSQMNGFGGMLSFELKEGFDAKSFRKSLQLIKSSMSLAGVESTVISPAETSHALMSAETRAEQGIKDGLIRFSLGIEETEDLISDIEQALNAVRSKEAIATH